MGLLVVQVGPDLGPPVLNVLTRCPDAPGLAHLEQGEVDLNLTLPQLGGKGRMREVQEEKLNKKVRVGSNLTKLLG